MSICADYFHERESQHQIQRPCPAEAQGRLLRRQDQLHLLGLHQEAWSSESGRSPIVWTRHVQVMLQSIRDAFEEARWLGRSLSTVQQQGQGSQARYHQVTREWLCIRFAFIG